MSVHALRAGVLLAVAAAGAWTQTAAPASLAPAIRGYQEWVQGRGKDVDLSNLDLDGIRRELSHFDPATIPVPPALSPADAREVQRRYVTAFALEAAAVGSIRHAAEAARLVEWACPSVRTHTPLNDFDRAWQLGALAVLEGGIQPALLQEHVDHTRASLNDEPRLTLASGIVDEQISAPAEVRTREVIPRDAQRTRDAVLHEESERGRAAERAIQRFGEGAAVDAVKAEATLRLGHVQYRLGRYDAALATWANLDESASNDKALLYLLHVFRGTALERRARYEEARDSYTAALRVSPGAHSATMRLAALEFRARKGDDPSPLLTSLLRNDDMRIDPWWSYYAGDWRFWYLRIARVRSFLK
jgi:tetratricopeptide (TPR) repeat protein